MKLILYGLYDQSGRTSGLLQSVAGTGLSCGSEDVVTPTLGVRLTPTPRSEGTVTQEQSNTVTLTLMGTFL